MFDYDPANDTGWTWFTFILEMISLGTTCFLLGERISGLVLLISAVCLFGLDFTFAYFHHKYKGTECLIENQKRLFLPEMRPGTMAGAFANYATYLEQKIKDDTNRKYGRKISAFLIWFLCAIKGGAFFIAVVSSYWFQMAVRDSKTPYLLIIFIIASYLWIAYNHLKFTGYFIAGFSHNRKYNSEFAEYSRNVGKQNNINERQVIELTIDLKKFAKAISGDNTNPYLLHFVKKSSTDLQEELNEGIKELEVQPHGLHKGTQENIYIIYRYGLLTDNQLQQMIDVQKNDLARLAVAVYGHKLQMQSGHFDTNI